MSSQGVVYQVVRHHFESFRAQAAGLRDGEGLPRFVEQAALARSASASHAVASAEAGVSRVAEMRVPGPLTRLRAIPSKVEGWWVFPFGPCSVSCATWLT